MEGILIFIVIIFGWAIFKMLVTKAARVVKKVVTGKDTYFGPAMIKLVDDKHEDSNLKFKSVMFRGKLPVSHTMELSFAISILDATDGEKSFKPIISIIDAMHESTCDSRLVVGLECTKIISAQLRCGTKVNCGQYRLSFWNVEHKLHAQSTRRCAASKFTTTVAGCHRAP